MKQRIGVGSSFLDGGRIGHPDFTFTTTHLFPSFNVSRLSGHFAASYNGLGLRGSLVLQDCLPKSGTSCVVVPQRACDRAVVRLVLVGCWAGGCFCRLFALLCFGRAWLF